MNHITDTFSVNKFRRITFLGGDFGTDIAVVESWEAY